VEKNAPDGVVKLIVGTKSDLTENRVVSFEQGKALAASCNALFMETSAKDGTGGCTPDMSRILSKPLWLYPLYAQVWKRPLIL
jgi:hypothetical protein